MAMNRWFATSAAALLFATGVAAASDLAPGNGYSIQLGEFDGSVYYTVEPDGYRVVATLASKVEQLPIRFVSTLERGQSMTISVPRAAGQAPVDMNIVRNGETLVMGDQAAASAAVDDAVTLGSIEP
jgi:hypothetical protein